MICKETGFELKDRQKCPIMSRVSICQQMALMLDIKGIAGMGCIALMPANDVGIFAHVSL